MGGRLMRERESFREVLHNIDDQVIVRQLLVELVPDAIKAEVLNRFNQHAREWNERVNAQDANG